MSSPLPPLNPEAFNVLLELCDENDLSTIESVVNQFLEDLPPLLQRLADARANLDFPGVRHAAHSLKGSTATFGLAQVENAARNLEAASNSSDAVALKHWYGLLRDALPPACEAIRTHMNALKNEVTP